MPPIVRYGGIKNTVEEEEIARYKFSERLKKKNTAGKGEIGRHEQFLFFL